MKRNPLRLTGVSPYLLLTLATLFWAGNAVVARALHTLLPPATMAFWRWMLALLLLLPFVLRPMHEQRALLRANWMRLALLGMLGVGCYNTFLYAALQTTTATNGVLINSMTPLLIVLIGRGLFGVRMTRRQQVGILLSLAGIIGIVSRGDIAVLTRLDFNHGDLVLIGGACTWALYTVLLRWRPAGIDTMAFFGASVVSGIVLLMLPLYLVELASGRVVVWNTATGVGMVYFAVFPSILSYLFWNSGVQEVGANRAGLFLYLVPVFGVVLAVTFLGERLHMFHLAGAVLIFTGIATATTGTSGARGTAHSTSTASTVTPD
jgi:drug/metabolite transporter (DMT)-like permease